MGNLGSGMAQITSLPVNTPSQEGLLGPINLWFPGVGRFTRPLQRGLYAGGNGK
jgi:hypothetical protein